MKWSAFLTYTNRFDSLSIPLLLAMAIFIIVYLIRRERFTSSQVNNFINEYPPVKKGIYNLTDTQLPL
jgi:hypothetical protein